MIGRRRWISSMKRMSPFAQVRERARRGRPASRARGRSVVRMFTPSSRAISSASVVLPSPGGPKKSAWSSGSRPRDGRVDVDAEAVLHLLLADELGEPLRPQRQLDDGLLGDRFGRGDLGAGVMARQSCRLFREPSDDRAPSRSLRRARASPASCRTRSARSSFRRPSVGRSSSPARGRRRSPSSASARRSMSSRSLSAEKSART